MSPWASQDKLLIGILQHIDSQQASEKRHCVHIQTRNRPFHRIPHPGSAKQRTKQPTKQPIYHTSKQSTVQAISRIPEFCSASLNLPNRILRHHRKCVCQVKMVSHIACGISFSLDTLRFAYSLHGPVDLLRSPELDWCFDDDRRQPRHDVPLHVAM